MKSPSKRPKPDNASPRRTRSTGTTSGEWQELTLARLRGLIMSADPHAVEEQKWKKPSNPEGVPVWYHDGIVCVANVLKNAVRLTFPNGPEIRDPSKLFNTRLDSKVVRAIDFFEDTKINEAAVRAIIREAVRLNASIVRERGARSKVSKR